MSRFGGPIVANRVKDEHFVLTLLDFPLVVVLQLAFGSDG
ncbi:hypothetical protein GCM10027341_56570 [Spirosoma knui]